MAKTTFTRHFVSILIALIALIALGVASSIPANATHNISYIKEKSGYYILCDTSGHQYQSVSKGRTHMIGWSSTYFVVSSDNGYYYVYDANGRKISELSKNKLGVITDVIENAIISQKNNYTYRWDIFGSRYTIISSS